MGVRALNNNLNAARELLEMIAEYPHKTPHEKGLVAKAIEARALLDASLATPPQTAKVVRTEEVDEVIKMVAKLKDCFTVTFGLKQVELLTAHIAHLESASMAEPGVMEMVRRFVESVDPTTPDPDKKTANGFIHSWREKFLAALTAPPKAQAAPVVLSEEHFAEFERILEQQPQRHSLLVKLLQGASSGTKDGEWNKAIVACKHALRFMSCTCSFQLDKLKRPSNGGKGEA